MRIRWSVVLPVLGLGWFAAVTYQSVRRDRGYSDLRSHLEWATWQLDADPLAWKTACNGQPQPCVTWGSPELRENWSRPPSAGQDACNCGPACLPNFAPGCRFRRR